MIKPTMTALLAQRPQVTLKLATSLDGRIATTTGHSKWITGPLARERVHNMRAEHDCVLTGIGTILADDPQLTARREPKPARQPLRVVIDSAARTPLNSKLLATLDHGPVCLFHGEDHGQDHLSDQEGLSRVRVSRDTEGHGLDLSQVLMALSSQFEVKSLMVEAGARVAGSFLRAGFVDKIVWFRAPLIIGGDGLPVFAALGVSDLSQAIGLECLDIDRCGRDHVETYIIKKTDKAT